MTRISTRERRVTVGDRFRLTQQIPFGVRCWAACVEGIVLGFIQAKTGAWYCHSRCKKLWLDRIVILQDSGEISDCILDQYSRLERMSVRSNSRTAPNAQGV